MVDSLYSRAVKKFGDQARAWTQPHLDALEQFNARKERGMNLSDRVWRLTNQFKSEMELALELGLGDGKSAAALSRDVRQYLNEPHRLFRRVRDEKGQLRLSKAAAAYHPGQGVYRSSYKNALRLTATENNMAYRTADHKRWNDLDFVIGIEIKLSGNHPIEDICDEMCGVYPKTFKFVGWHPFCRCYAVPKLADEDEFIARQQALIDGENVPQGGYRGEVTEMPQCFTNWVQQNAERIETAKSTPYFIQDNRAAVDKALQAAKAPTITTPTKRTIEEIAAERHATRDVSDIQRRWNNNREYHRLSADPNHRDVEFDYITGGLKATHVSHNFDRHKGEYERKVQHIGFSAGDAVVLGKEDHTAHRQRNVEGSYNNQPFEIAGAENGSPRNIRNALKHCVSKPEATVAVIYLPNGVTEADIMAGLRAFNGLKGKKGQWRKFQEIIFMDDNGIQKRHQP